MGPSLSCLYGCIGCSVVVVVLRAVLLDLGVRLLVVCWMTIESVGFMTVTDSDLLLMWTILYYHWETDVHPIRSSGGKVQCST